MDRSVRAVTFSAARENVGAARRFVADEIRGRVEDDMIDTAMLLTSEIVTNAVLHTHSDFSVHVSVAGTGVLIQVSDGSSLPPLPRHHDAEAVTGRGMELVEGLADDYGVLSTSAGKAVWFTLGGAAAPGQSGWEQPIGSTTEDVKVLLAGLPAKLCVQLSEHNEALLREYDLYRLASGADGRFAKKVTDAARARERIAAALREAVDGLPIGDDYPVTIDIRLAVPDRDLAAFEVLAEVLTDAERVATTGTLLSPPASPEITALRDWAAAEIVKQLHGGQPAAWPRPQ